VTGDAPLAVELRGIVKHFPGVVANDGVDFDLRVGEVHALLGENGAGKSTLVKMIYGLVHPDEGQMAMAGTPYAPATPHEARAAGVAMVFQHFSLFDALDVAENVALPLLLLGRPDAARVGAVLDAVGLGNLGARMPAQLSGGQLQRVAIARAVVHNPALILADEPTGNLDPDTAMRVLSVLVAQVRDAGAACLLVTHSLAAAERADRVLRLTPEGIAPMPGAARQTA